MGERKRGAVIFFSSRFSSLLGSTNQGKIESVFSFITSVPCLINYIVTSRQLYVRRTAWVQLYSLGAVKCAVKSFAAHFVGRAGLRAIPKCPSAREKKINL